MHHASRCIRRCTSLGQASRLPACAAQKLEEAKREARRRGDKKTQTSDARFDEKFQVGHGLSGEAGKPWYAKSGSMLQSEEAASLQVPTALPAPPTLAHTAGYIMRGTELHLLSYLLVAVKRFLSDGTACILVGFLVRCRQADCS